MTAIIGFTSADRNVAFLAADSIEAYSQTINDKLIKIQDRFVLGFVGMEIAKWAAELCIQHFDQFDSPTIEFNNVEKLQNHIKEIFPICFKNWKENKVMGSDKPGTFQNSQILLLDTKTNKIYIWELGDVWADNNIFDNVLQEAKENIIHAWGVVKDKDILWDPDDYLPDDLDKYFEKVFNHLSKIYSPTVGLLGSYQISCPHKSCFVSAFKRQVQVIEETIKRTNSISDLDLHEAIVVVLIDKKFKNRTATTQEIADEINRRKLYKRDDGNPVPAHQIMERSYLSNGHYHYLFEFEKPDKVKLRNL